MMAVDNSLNQALLLDVREVLSSSSLFSEIPIEQVGEDDGLQSTLGIDSLGFVELRFQCEKKFGIKISDDDFNPENFSSIRSLSRLVEKLLGNKKVAD